MATTELDMSKQFQKMIKDIDNMNDELIEVVHDSVKTAGETIAAHQKSIIGAVDPAQAGAIEVGKVYVTKNKGRVTIQTGYFKSAFNTHKGMVGLLYEYGRPGKKRKGVDKRGRKIGSWKNPVPHIRRGFDQKKDEVSKIAVETLETALRQFGKGV